MKTTGTELLCSCGHLASDHNTYPPNTRCRWDDGDIGGRCSCIKFMLDNLLYLEELDKQYYHGS